MSIAELFYAKQKQRARLFGLPFRRDRKALPKPHRRKILLEPLEPRLLLSSVLEHQILPGVNDLTLRVVEEAGTPTVQLIDNSSNEAVESRALADTSSIVINGSGDADCLIVDFSTSFSTPVTFKDTSSTDSDILGVINSANRTWNLTGPNSGTVAGIQFEGIENLCGTDLSDQFIFSDGWGAVSIINPGTRDDVLDFSNVSADLTFFIYDHGTVAVTDRTNTVRETAGIETIKGGIGDNTFRFDDGGSFAGSIRGGTGGINALDYSAYTTGVTVDLVAGTATGTTGVAGIQNLIGGSGADTLTGDAQANKLTGGGGNDRLAGGAGDDTYALTPDSGTDTIVETSGTDALDYSAYTTGVTVDLEAGTAPWTTGVNGIENVIGGSGADTLAGNAGANVLAGGPGDDVYIMKVNAGTDTIVEKPGEGSDTFDYSAFKETVTVNLAAGTATGLTSGFDNLENVIGGSGADSLTGDENANVLTGGGGNDTLAGGAGDDTYILTSDPGTKTIVETPNEGSDTLDYSAFSRAVTVDMAAGTATGLTAGFANIENVIGGSGNDTIIGNAVDNVLAGGPGADSISGGGGTDTLLEKRDADFTLTSFSLVIGSEGTDLLTGMEAVHLIGGPGDNDFNLAAFTVGSIWLDGGGGNDTYDFGSGAIQGTLRLKNDDLTISSNLFATANIELIADDSLTINNGVTISTRQIGAGGDPLTSPSTGDSGNISLEAKTISIGSGARLLSQVEDGSVYSPGDILLQAYKAAHFSGMLVLTLDDADTIIEMQDATIKGGNVTISAASDSARNANDDSPATITTPDMFQDSGLDEEALDFLTTLSIFAGVAISNASATIVIGQNTVIEASNLTMFAGSQTEATISTESALLGVAVGVSNSDAHITVENGARITAKHDLSIESSACDEMDVEAMQHYALPSDGPEKVNLCLAIGVSDVHSTAVIESGATLEAGGDLSVEALMDRSINVSAPAVAYEDGTFATGVAISYADADATAAIDGTAHATGDLLVRTDSQSQKDDISASTGVGASLILAFEKAALGKLPDKHHLNEIDTWYRREFGRLLDYFSGSTTTLALSAAVAFADQSNDATARVGNSATVSSQTGDVDVHSSILLVPETSAISWIDSEELLSSTRFSKIPKLHLVDVQNPAGNTKENSFSAAVVLGFFENTANATIGAGAQVDAGGDVSVHAENRTPYDIQWRDLQSFSDLTDKMNLNFGIQNGLFTSWAQSNAQGEKTAIGGSVDVFELENHTNAIIYENAKLTAGGAVRVQATTEVEAVHLSGVFGVMGVIIFPGSASGEGGVGGAYLQVNYDDHTNALIKSGAKVTAETLVVYADTVTRNVSIAESGGAADKYGVNGSVSLLMTDNNTLAQIDDGATVTTGSGEVRLAKDVRDRFGDDSFKIIPYHLLDENVENVPLVLDSNLDGVVDSHDDDIDYVDPGTDAKSPKDDAYVLKENQFIAAGDESQIFNFGGGIVKGRNVGIGASVAINDIDRDTRALVGNRAERVSQRGFSPASGVDSTDAIHLGYSDGYANGDAVLYTSGDGTPIGGLTSGGRYYVSSVDGTTVRLARSAAEASNAPSTYFTPASVNGSTGVETITLGYTHGFQLGDAVVYHNGGGTSIGGLVDGQTYYVIPIDGTTIALAGSADEALAESRNLFRAQDAVDAEKDTIDFGNRHGLTTGQAVVYRNGGGASIGGLTNGAVYYAVVQDDTVIKLAATHANAIAATPVTLDLRLPATADGSLHSLQPAFDPATAVDGAADTIDLGYQHDLVTGDPIIYSPNAGTSIGGLTSGGRYYAIVVDAETVALANSEADAAMAKPRLFTPFSDVNSSDDSIHLLFHNFQTGDAVVYGKETGSDIGGLTSGGVYYIRRIDENTVKLAPTRADAQNGTNLINLDASAASGTHWLRGNTRIDLNASSSSGDAHTIRPDLRVGLDPAAGTGTGHSFRLALDPSQATGLVHAIGRIFDPATAVNGATDAIDLGYSHGFTTGQAVAYSCGYGKPIGGIGEGQVYYAVVVNGTTIKLAASEADALAGPVIDLDPSAAAGSAHAIGAVIPATPAVDKTTGAIDFGVHHGYTTGQAITYHTGGGQAIGGLVDGQTYYAVVISDTAIQLAQTKAAALATTPTILSLDPSTTTGSAHYFSDPDDLAGSIASGGNMAVLARNDGEIVTATLAASVVTEHNLGGWLGGAKNPYGGDYGISVSGDVSVNVISDETEAFIKDAAVTKASKLEVDARTTDDIYAGAGSVSISWKDKNSVGIAGSVTTNDIDNDTKAFIENSTVNLTGDLTVTALTTGEIWGIAAGGSGSLRGVGVMGSVSINVISQDTFGYVLDSNIASVHDVALAATSSSEITGVAGAASFGGRAGVGASVGVDVTTNKTRAYAEDSDIIATGGVSITTASGAEGQDIPIVFDPVAGVDGDMNLITFTAPTLVGYGEEVTYDNQGGQSIGGLKDGNKYSVIVLDGDTIALADSSDHANRAQKQFDSYLDVDDASDSIYLGPNHGLTTADAVYYRDAADYQDTGSSPNGDIGLTHGTFYYAIVEGEYIRLATTKANAVNGIAVDIHPYYKMKDDNPDAMLGVRQAFLIQKEFVDLATGSGTGEKQSLQVWNHDILGISAALGVSASSKARMAGAFSLTVNTVTNHTYAGISGKKVQGLVSGADVIVSATDSTEIMAVAGAVDVVAGIGVDPGIVAGFGASVAYNSIEGPVQATIADATVKSAGKVDLTALSDGTIWSLALAGSVSTALNGTAALAISGVGSGSRNTVTNTTESVIADSTIIMNNRDAVTLTARDETSIVANAYGGAIVWSDLAWTSLAVSVGVSVAINHIDTSVRAALENSVLGQIGDLTITASADGSIQATSVAAALSFEANSQNPLPVSVSGGGAEATNYIGPDVAAYLSHTDLPGAGKVTIGATDDATVTATIVAAAAAGNISPKGGWSAGIGVSVARNFIGWSPDTSTSYQWSTDEGLAQGQTLSNGDRVLISSGARAGDVYKYLGDSRTQPTATYTATNVGQTVTLSNGTVVAIASDFDGKANAGSLYKYVGTGATLNLASADYLGSDWEEVRIDLRSEDYGDADLWTQVNLGKTPARIQAYTQDSAISAAGGLAITAQDEQTIDAVVAAAAVALSGGANTGTDVTGAGVGVGNHILSDIDAYIDGDGATGVSAPTITITADDSSGIDAVAGAGALAGAFATTTGTPVVAFSIGLSVAINEIDNDVQAYIRNADTGVTTTAGDLTIKASSTGRAAFSMDFAGRVTAAGLDDAATQDADDTNTTIDEAAQDAADDQVILEALRTAFGDHGVSLSGTLSLTALTAGSRWLLVNEYGDTYVLEAVSGKLQVSETSITAVSTAASIAATFGSTAVSPSGAGAGSGNTITSDTRAFLENSRVTSSAAVSLDAASDMTIAATVVAPSLSVGIGKAGVGAAIGVASAHNQVGSAGDGVVETSLQNSTVNATGNLSLHAVGDQDISSTVAAACGAVAIGVNMAGGLSGSIAIANNEIETDVNAFINGDGTGVRAGSIAINASETSTISAVTIAPSLSGVLGVKTAGVSIVLGAGVAHNTIRGTVAAYVKDAADGIQSTLGSIVLTATDGPSITAWSVAPSMSLGGGYGGVALGGGGADARNVILTAVDAYISGSKVVSAAGVSLSAGESATIVARIIGASASVAGGYIAVGASIGSSTASNFIGYTEEEKRSPAPVCAWVSGSDLTAHDLSVTATANATVDAEVGAFSVALAGGFGGAAVSGGGVGLDNRVAMQVDAYIDGKVATGIDAATVTINAKDTSTITAKGLAAVVAGYGGPYGGSAAIGVAVVDDLITSDVQAWVKNTTVTASGDLSVLATEKATIDASALAATLAASISIGGTLSGGGGTISSTVETTTQAYVDTSTLALGGDLIVTSDSTIAADAVMGGATGSLSLIAIAATGSVTTVTVTPIVEAWVSGRTVHARNVSITAQATPFGSALSDSLTVSTGGAVGVAKATTEVSPTVSATVGGDITADSLSVVAKQVLPSDAKKTAKAEAQGALGGLLIGVDTSFSTATGNAVVTSGVNDEAHLQIAQLTSVIAASQSLQVAESNDAFGGLLAGGAAKSTSKSGGTTEASLGAGVTFTGGDLIVGASGDDTNSATSTAGSGGLVAGNAAMVSTNDTSSVTTTVGDRTTVVGGEVAITAEHSSGYAVHADSVNGAVVGGNGADADVDLSPTVSVAVGSAVHIDAAGAVLVSAQNARQKTSGDANAEAGAGGVFYGSAATSHTTVTGTSSVTFGDAVTIDSGTDPVGNPGDITIVASSILAGLDLAENVTGGVITGAGSEVDLTATLTNSINLGTNGSFTSQGNVGAGTYATVVTEADAEVSTWSLAGTGVAKATTHLTTTQTVAVGAGTHITAFGNVNLTAGQDPTASCETFLTPSSIAQAYVNDLISIPQASAATTAVSNASLTIASGTVIQSGQSVTIGAYPGTPNPVAEGTGHGYEFGFSVNTDDSSVSSSTTADVTFNGTITAGIYHELTITIPDSKDSAVPENSNSKVYSSQLTTNSGGAPFTWGYSVLSPPAYIKDHFSDTEEHLLDQGTSSAPVGAMTIGTLYASGGTVTINGDTIAGTGTVNAHGGPTITVTNNSPDYLIMNAVKIPDTPGGEVLFTGKAEEAPSLHINEIGKGVAPVITIINAYDGPVGSSTYGPALFLMGTIENLGGLLTITNVSGSLGQTQTIYAKQENISAPKGNAVFDLEGNQPEYAMGQPYSQWKKYILRPTSPQDAIAYVVNALYNSTGAYTTPAALTQAVIGFAGDAPPDNYSYDFFGDGVPWTDVYLNDSSKQTAITRSLIGQAYKISNSADSTYGWFSMIPLRTLTKVGDYSQADVSGSSTPSAITGAEISINAMYVDINGEITAGQSTDLSVKLASDLKIPVSVLGVLSSVDFPTYQHLYAYGLAPRTVSLPIAPVQATDSTISATYDAATNQITLQDARASSFGGSVSIHGGMISTDQLGKIHVNGGMGKVVVDNETGIPLVVQQVYVGAGLSGTVSRVEITDTLKDASSNHWLYLYQPGVGISVYHGAAADNLGHGTPESQTTGTSATYAPSAGLRWQWQEKATLTRGTLPSWPPAEWVWNSYPAGDANNPWQFVDPATGNLTTTPMGQLITQAGLPFFQQTITGWSDTGKTYNVHYHSSDPDNTYFNYGFRKTNPPDNPPDPNGDKNWYALWVYHYPYNASLTLTMSVKADNPIGIYFSGPAVGSVSVTSNAAVTLAGDIINPEGDVSIQATGSITETSSGTVSAHNLTLAGTQGIGTATSPFTATLSEGVLDVQGGSAGVYLDLHSGAQVNRVSSQTGTTYGDVVITADDDLVAGPATLASGAAHVSGRNIMLESSGGSVGTLSAPLVISAHPIILTGGGTSEGIVNVTALEDIGIRQRGGNLLVGTIASQTGDVYIGVEAGDLYDISGQNAVQMDPGKTTAVWSRLHLTSEYGAEANASLSVTAFEHLVETNYQEYWHLMQNGTRTGDVYTLYNSSLDAYRPRAAAALNLTTPTDDKVRAYAAHLYAAAAAFFDNVSLPADSTLGLPATLAPLPAKLGPVIADWRSLRDQSEKNDFNTFNPNFVFTASSAQATTLTQNAVWTEGDLRYPVHSTALGTAGVSAETSVPSVIGRNVTLDVSGSIGRLADPIEIALADIKSGNVSDDQAQALALATAPGTVTAVGTDKSTGAKVELTFDQYVSRQDTVTLTGVKAARTQAFFVEASGTFTPHAGGASFIQATNREFSISSLNVVGDLSLVLPGDVTIDQATIQVSGALTITASGDISIVSGSSVNAGTIVLNAAKSLSIAASSVVTTVGSVALISGSSVSVSGSACFAATDITVTAAHDVAFDPFTSVHSDGVLTIQGDAGNADPGVGTVITLLSVTGANRIDIFGESDSDTITIGGSIGSTVISAGAGADTINVQKISGATTINAGTENDTITVGSLAPATGGNVNGIAAALTINGEAGTDTLIIDDSGDTQTNSGILTGTTLTGLGMSTPGITYGTMEALTVSLGSGGDTLTIQSTNAGTTTTINANAGNDTINVHGISGATTVNAGTGNDTITVGSLAPTTTGGNVNALAAALTVNGDAGTDSLTVDDSGDTLTNSGILTGTTLTGLGMSTPGITYGGLETLTVSLGSGADTLTIQGTQTGTTTVNGNAGNDTITVKANAGVTTLNGGAGADAINVQAVSAATTVNAGNDNDTIIVGSLASTLGGNVNSITAGLTINGDAGTDILTVDDSGDTLANTGILTATTVTGLGMSTPGITYGGLETLTVSLGSGADTFAIQGTHAGTTTTVNGNGGNDTITVGSLAPVTANGIAGALTINGNAGTDTLTVDDSGDTLANTGTLTATAITGLGMTAGITYGTMETLTVSLGSGADTFAIQGTHAGTTTTVNGNGGNDTITVGSLAPVTVNGIAAALTINGNAGTDTLTVDDSGDTQTNSGVLTATTVTGLGMSTPGITYGTLEVLTVSLGSGADTFAIQGTHAGTTTVNGNGGNDTINVQKTSGATTVNAGSQNDTINVGSLAPTMSGGTVNVITASLTVTGDSNDYLNIDDTGDTVATTGTLTTTALTGLGMGAGINYASLGVLNISLGSGADTFTIESTGGGGTTVYGNAGDDAITLVSNAGTTILFGGAGGDHINIQTISASAGVSGGDGDDTIVVGSAAPSWSGGTVNSIAAGLTVSGDAGTDTLIVDDTGDTLGNSGMLTSSYLLGLGMSVGITNYQVESLSIHTGSGNDAFDIMSTGASISTGLYTNAGNDTITYPASNHTIYIDSGSGSDTINGLPGGGLLGAIHPIIFEGETGLWTLGSGSYAFAPEAPGGDALGVFHIVRIIPTYFELTATIRADKPIAGSKANAYLVFDYQSAADFKFAGLNVSTNQLEIGYRDATGWHVVAQRPYTGSLKSDTDYDVSLSINGSTATLTVEDRASLTHNFPTRVDENGVVRLLNGGMLGLGARDAKGQITNVMGHVPAITRDQDDTAKLVAETAGSAGATLNPDALDPIVQAAVARWEATLRREAPVLDGVAYTITDLPGLTLGEAAGTSIVLDSDAAGHGWYIDATPADDREFLNGAPPEGMDLLTVVMHELGHVLGFSDVAPAADTLMSGTLASGERHLGGGNGVGDAGGAGRALPPSLVPTNGAERAKTAGGSSLIDWERPYGGERLLGRTDGGTTAPDEIVPRILDFTVQTLPSHGNGNGNGYAYEHSRANGNGVKATQEGGAVAWGPLNGRDRHGLDVVEFDIALEPKTA